MGNAEQDSISHISHISQGVDTNADQNSISHISHISQSRNSRVNVGLGLLLFLVLTVLILLLLDRFVLEGKIFAWLFGQLKLQDHSEVTEQKVESRGFEGRSLDDI